MSCMHESVITTTCTFLKKGAELSHIECAVVPGKWVVHD